MTVKVAAMLSKSVYPSGGAAAAISVPTTPPAPVRFSTTTLWFSCRPSATAASLAAVSLGPPAAIGAMMRMGRDG